MTFDLLAWLALRLYLAYAYNNAHHDSTWANGLDISSGFVSGTVTDGTDPIEGADVILVDGTQTANPQSLTSYIAETQTDAEGCWSLPFETTGNKTIYVVKSGYKHEYKTYNFGATDQNIVFPTAALEGI